MPKAQSESKVISGFKGGKFSGIREAAKVAKEVGASVTIEVDAPEEEEKHESPKQARIEQIENGYLICWYDNDGKPYPCGGEEKHAAADLEEAMGILKKYMGA